MSGSKRWLVALAVATLGSSVIGAPTASAVPPTGSTSITVFLKAPNVAALDRLASTHGLTHAQRVAAVSALIPSAAAHRAVRAELSAQGFRVTSETSWSITATGSRARSDSLFGTRPAAGARASAARIAAATGALPRIPTGLSGVAAVFPTVGGPQAYHHSAALTGTDFRNADTPATVAPSTGAHTTGVTVATLQLADFYGVTPGFSNSQTAADLTSYASEHGLADPVTQPAGNPRYRAIKIDGGPGPADDNPADEGDVEVALDQESILSTAPSANQHAYFAPNTDAGYNDVFAAVLDDVLGTSHATAADPHLAALSVSWGACEAATSDSAIATLEPILKSLLAAGVTVFASSGDDGIYDCGDSTSGVDYPASSPSVVGVGGSHLVPSHGSAANTGANWSETSWQCTSVTSCVDTTGGSGGGASALFAAPSYQQAGIDDAPFAGNPLRLVPDITADGDPQTGFVLYSSNPAIGPSHQQQEGGTSLASPISAAQLANTLGDAARTTGVGDIHPALYSAYRQTKSLATTNPLKAFRDVTAGTNGAAAARGANPSVRAQAGYDTNSGVGGVLWSALLPYLADTRTPTASAVLTEPHRKSSRWRTVSASWHVATGKILAGPTQVTITANGTPVFTSNTLPASSSRAFTAKPGQTYVLTVTGTDIAGRESRPVSTTLRVPVDDSAFTFSTNWQRVRKSGDFGGSHARSTTKGAPARVTAVGHKFVLRVVTSPTSGKLGVYKGKRLLTKINLHSASAGHRLVTIFTTAAPRQRTFTFRPLGHAKVGVDSLQVTY